MADIVREGVVRLRTEVVKEKLDGPDLSPWKKARDEYNRSVQDSLGLLERESKSRRSLDEQRSRQIQAEVRRQAESRQQIVEASRSQRELNDATLRGAEGLRTAADGAFTFARGLALTNLEGDNLNRSIEAIARIQGQFDLFRGGVDTLRGGVEAARNLGTAFSAAAVFLGPGGTIAVGAAAAGAAIVALYTTLSRETESALDRAEERFDSFIQRSRQQQAELSASRRRASAVRGLQSQDQQIAELRDRLKNGPELRSIGDIVEPASIFTLTDNVVRLGRAEAESLRDINRRTAIEELTTRGQRLDGRQSDATELLRLLNSREETANRLREAGISGLDSQLAGLRGQRDQTSERLADAVRARQIEQENRVLELDALAPGVRSRVTDQLGRIGELAKPQLDFLANTAPRNAGDAVRAEKLRRAGETPLIEPDRVDQLTQVLEKLDAKLDSVGTQRTDAVENDEVFDEQARRASEPVIRLLERVAVQIEQNSIATADLQGQLEAASQ